MNDNATTMKNEIHMISKYRALILSKYYICIALIGSTTYMGIYKYPISPLYILLFLIILPPVIEFALKDYADKYNRVFLNKLLQENAFQLKNLKRKYHYTKISYFTNQTAYLTAMFLICLWQFSNRNITYANDLLSKLPLIIFATGIFIRCAAAVFLPLKLHLDLMYNRV